MDKANFKNGNNKYPLSTDTLEFMQRQIHLAYGLSGLYDANYIIRQSTADTDGLIVVEGELMPLKGKPNARIFVSEDETNIEAGGQTFSAARVTRYASYAAASARPRPRAAKLGYSASGFKVLQPISEHIVPKGVIVMWSGTIDEIPYGWRLCDGTNGTPDLSGRFVVGYDADDADYDEIGNAGGEKAHKLTAAEMPKHNHNSSNATIDGNIASSSSGEHTHSIIFRTFGKKLSGKNENNRFARGEGDTQMQTLTASQSGSHTHTTKLYARGGDTAHENRPPYFVLAYIMKTI